MNYKKVEKEVYLDKRELRDNINSLAAEIREGEEDVMEGYEEAVQQYAELTRMSSPCF